VVNVPWDRSKLEPTGSPALITACARKDRNAAAIGVAIVWGICLFEIV
jgi:hypothetical protein